MASIIKTVVFDPGGVFAGMGSPYRRYVDCEPVPDYYEFVLLVDNG